jgi:hypothetical protein
MRLSDWRGRTPHRDSMTSKVVDVIVPVVRALGADPDPACWVVWGDDPAIRYVVLVPTPAGLLQVHVRVNVPQEGPRASAKLVRWSRVQIGELAMEMASGHRLLSFQVEGQVLKGADEDAEAIAAFALDLLAAIDGRVPAERPPVRAKRATSTKGARSASTARRTARQAEPARLPPPSGG